MAEAKRRPFAIYEFSPSMTKQSFKDEVNINSIVERAVRSQDFSILASDRVARYGDFSDVPSYQEALDLVNRAKGMFDSMDATIKERFSNDPGRMIAFLQDAGNYDEAVKLGLVVAKDPVVSGPVVDASDMEARLSDLEDSMRSDRGDSVRPKASSDAKKAKA